MWMLKYKFIIIKVKVLEFFLFFLSLHELSFFFLLKKCMWIFVIWCDIQTHFDENLVFGVFNMFLSQNCMAG